MPTYIRPARVDITEGRGIGGLVLIGAAAAAVAAVVGFVAVNAELLAVCGVVFVTVMGGILAVMRWLVSPRRLRRHPGPPPAARVLTARPARPLSASRPRAIGAPRTVAESPQVNRARIPRVR